MSATSLSLLKKHTIVDHSDDDELLQHYLDTAEGWIQNYVGVTLATLSPVPAELKQAAMLLASYWYEQREAVSAGVSMGAVPFGVLDLIRPHREWSFADAD
jgi:uncharacterized phage protein (predicted DNA packaging)